MRIRTIKPQFWTDIKIQKRSLSARLTFIGLWNFADDAGYFQAEPRLIKAALYPVDDSFTVDNVSEALSELSVNAHIKLYESHGEKYGYIPNFTKHQRINRPTPSVFPRFSDGSVSTQGVLFEPSSQLCAGSGVVSGSGSGVGSGNGSDLKSVPPKAAEPTAESNDNGPEWPESAETQNPASSLIEIPRNGNGARPEETTSPSGETRETWDNWTVVAWVLESNGWGRNEIKICFQALRGILHTRGTINPIREVFVHILAVGLYIERGRRVDKRDISFHSYMSAWLKKHLDSKNSKTWPNDDKTRAAKQAFEAAEMQLSDQSGDGVRNKVREILADLRWAI